MQVRQHYYIISSINKDSSETVLLSEITEAMTKKEFVEQLKNKEAALRERKDIPPAKTTATFTALQLDEAIKAHPSKRLTMQNFLKQRSKQPK